MLFRIAIKAGLVVVMSSVGLPLPGVALCLIPAARAAVALPAAASPVARGAWADGKNVFGKAIFVHPPNVAVISRSER